MLTVDEAADHLRVSVKTLRREIAAGRLPVVRVRRCITIDPVDLEAYISANKRCQSAATATVGKSGFKMPGFGLAELLGIERTPSSLKGPSAPGSRIVSLAERRATRSRKPSRAG